MTDREQIRREHHTMGTCWCGELHAEEHVLRREKERLKAELQEARQEEKRLATDLIASEDELEQAKRQIEAWKGSGENDFRNWKRRAEQAERKIEGLEAAKRVYMREMKSALEQAERSKRESDEEWADEVARLKRERDKALAQERKAWEVADKAGLELLDANWELAKQPALVEALRRALLTLDAEDAEETWPLREAIRDALTACEQEQQP